MLRMKCVRNNADTAVTLRDYCENFRPSYLFYFPINFFFIVNLRFCSMPKFYLVRISLLMFNSRFLPLNYKHYNSACTFSVTVRRFSECSQHFDVFRVLGVSTGKPMYILMFSVSLESDCR